MPIGPVESLLEIVASLVPLAADGATIDFDFESSCACVAAVHVDPALERSLMDVAARPSAPRMVVPIAWARGMRGRLSVWSERPLSPIAEAFVCASAAHAGAVLDAGTAIEDGFLAMVGHEVRAPLQALKLGIELIRIRARDTADDLPRRWVLDRCERLESSVDRLRSVADRLLDVTQIGRGVRVCPTPAELGEVVRGVVARHAPELDRSGNAVVVDQPRLVRGEWDVVHVDTIVSNLLTNAMKYAPGMPIAIALSGDDERVQIVVRDHGPGFGPLDRGRIFERFVRGEASATVHGLGVGLWMSRLLAEAQGGTLGFCESEGAGAAFVLELPRVVTAAESLPAPSR